MHFGLDNLIYIAGAIRNIFPNQQIFKNWCEQFYSVLPLRHMPSLLRL